MLEESPSERSELLSVCKNLFLWFYHFTEKEESRSRQTPLCSVTGQRTIQNRTLRVKGEGGAGKEVTGPNWDFSGQTETCGLSMSFTMSLNLSLLKAVS